MTYLRDERIPRTADGQATSHEPVPEPELERLVRWLEAGRSLRNDGQDRAPTGSRPRRPISP